VQSTTALGWPSKLCVIPVLRQRHMSISEHVDAFLVAIHKCLTRLKVQIDSIGSTVMSRSCLLQLFYLKLELQVSTTKIIIIPLLPYTHGHQTAHTNTKHLDLDSL
jgi:hypothetical protein